MSPSPKLIVFAILAMLATWSGPVEAKECRWFGTAPLCDGSCPGGWTLEELSGKGCIGTWGISGTKAYCCKVEAPCKYGTPGCPYPPFGSSGNEATPPSSGPQPPPDVIKGRQQESSGSGSDVLVPEPSTGPSPFGSSTKPPIDTGILKQRPDAYKVLPPAQAVNPCGKGMHKGGDGKCYPNLN